MSTGLTWAYVHFQGTLAVIEVVEKTRPSSELPGDVVAAKDGVVTLVLVFVGDTGGKPGPDGQGRRCADRRFAR